MQAQARKIQSATFVAFCFTMLAATDFGVSPALAQDSQEACPPPPGVTPVAPPDPTAQEVEAGTGQLSAFAMASRERSREQVQNATNVAQGLYIGCLVRQPDGPWRSGGTYIVSLTLDGRIVLHAKDMSLSGRLLNPLIYSTVLGALGVPADTLANLANPATALAAFGAIRQILSAEPIAPFDATSPIPNVRPGIPGAKGYAAVYSDAQQNPVILLTGFDIGEVHLAQEPVDYGEPTVTAEQVVDRETLKAFVTAAGNYFLQIQQSGDLIAASRVKTALRDEAGPWRHGNVYLYVLDTSSNFITFHAAFPDRYEFKPLIPTVLDSVTGELILPQVIDAARSGPEGGFVQYYFDDPTDDTDSSSIPKVGYAREFAGSIPLPDGSQRPARFIVGSGFYLSASGVVAHRQNLAIETIQPQVMRTMTASTVDAVSSRIEQAIAGDATQTAGLNFGGAASLSDALAAHGQSLESGTFDFGQLLAGSAFTLPLNAAGSGGLFRDVTIWGSGDYRDFSGGDRQVMYYEGNVTSINFGMDSRVGTDLLAGFSVSWAEAEVDYDDFNRVSGESTTTLTSVNPYVGWQASDSINVWATAGYGWGDVEINDDAAATQESDLEQQMAAAGVNGLLVDSDQVIEGGTTTVRIKAEAAYTWADIDGEGTLEGVTLDANRSRLMLEATHERPLDSGATMTSSLEVGVRHDGGDGEDGEGFETGAGLRYADPASGVTFEGRARALLGHDGDYDEWGFSGLVRIDPGADGVGLAVSLQPQWGQTASGVQQMWEADAIGGAVSDSQSPLRVNARVAYGMVALWGRRQGVLTPYTDVSLAGEGSQRLSLGGQFNIGSSVQMSLEVLHDQPAYGDSSNGVMLRSNFNW